MVMTDLAFEDEPPVRRGGRLKRTYRCRHCARVFKRSEHCARHERVHTHEKPFSCAYCDKRYARKDLVKRHERTLHSDAYRKAHPEEYGDSSIHGSESSGPGDFVSRIISRRQMSILTPPTTFASVIEGTMPDLRDALDVNAVPAPLGFTPPSSNDGEPCIFPTEVEGFALDSNQVPTLQALHPYSLDWGFETEPPVKRRRIETDPFIVRNPDVFQTPTLHTRNNFNSDAIDPALEQAHIAAAPGSPTPIDSRELSGPCDFSSDYLSLFDFDDLLPVPAHLQEQDLGSGYVVQKETPSKLREIYFDEGIHTELCEDARTRLPSVALAESLLPTLNDLRSFFSGYVDCFHQHFPIIHLPSFHAGETPSPLVFAICSIGAQYRLSRQKAKNLFALAGMMSADALRGGLPLADGSPQPAALWIMQTRVLLSLCGMFSGITKVVLRTVENLGLFAIDYRLRKAQLARADCQHMEWEDWISRESSKRLLCGMFVVSNLISSTFGVTPGFSHTDDLEFEILEEEQLWIADSSRIWRSRKELSKHRNRPTVRDAMTHLILNEEQQNDMSCEISGFTMLVVTHAVAIYVGSLRGILDTSPESLRNNLSDCMLAALSRCQDIIHKTRGREGQTMAWGETEGPLMFNCQGLLVMAYVRLFTKVNALHQFSLLDDNHESIVFTTRAYAEVPQQRSRNLTQVIKKTYEHLTKTIRFGHLLLRKTAAQSWSLEHAVAGWSATLLLTKWIHTLETETFVDPPDVEEVEVLESLKRLLLEGNVEHTGSLAAAVAKFCSSTLNDVWVWGVTPRMGNVLQQLAVTYEKRYQALQLVPIGYDMH